MKNDDSFSNEALRLVLSLLLLSFALLYQACDPALQDPCQSVLCKNGGHCDEGTCICPPGYSGPNCENFDPCHNKNNCKNGGTCVNGQCECPPGYSGPNCENYDPCHNKDYCKNGGACLNGQCECPPGFTGLRCETAVAPKYIRLDKVVLLDFPAKRQNGLTYWDPTRSVEALPDISLRILQDGNEVAATPYYTNCSSNKDYVYILNPPVLVRFEARCTVEIRDADPETNSSEPMGGYYFDVKEASNGFPTKFLLYNSTTWHQTKLEVYVTWVF